MKVLYFHQHFTTPTQGGGIRSYQFAKKLIEKGHSVTMVSGQRQDLSLKSTNQNNIFRGEVDGIDVIQIAVPYSNKFGLVKRAQVFMKFAMAGIKIALKEDYDLLFATSTPLTAGIPGIFMKWMGKKKKFVFEVRDLWPELPKALGVKNPFALGGMSWLEKVSYRRANACIGLSPGICEGIKKRAQKNKPITLIPNGCDLDIFKPGDRANLKLEGVKDTDKVAVFTGAHGIANGLDSILDMAHELQKRQRDDIKIVFVGDGKEKERIVERAKNEGLINCLFFNPVPKKELNEIVANADIGLMVLKNVPEFYYGTSPNKFFDYISSGLPVVNNYPGWLADMIKSNNCGEAIEPDNAILFADAVEKLADNPNLRKEYGKNARALAERDFARDMLADKFVSVLEETYNS